MSAEQKLTIMNHICQAMQEKLQSLEIFTKELTEQNGLLKTQNKNLSEDLDKNKIAMAQYKTENDYLRQEIMIYKNHLYKISKFFEILVDTNEIPLKQGIEEVKNYLEKNFLDKLSDSVNFDENNNFYEKASLLTPNINLSNSKAYEKNLSETNFLRFRQSARKITVNFPVEKNKNYYESMSKYIVAPKYTSLITSPKTGGILNRKKALSTNEQEEICFKDNNENNVMTINFVQMKSQSFYNVKKSEIIEKSPSDEFLHKTTMESPIPKKSFHSKTNSERPLEKLFEKLYVIGIQKNDIYELEKTSSENSYQEANLLSPKVLYNYPKMAGEELVIQDFAFPFGVPVEPIRGVNTFSKINEYIFSNHQNDQTFLFNVKPPETYQKKLFKNNKILVLSNPNRMLYAICVITHDYYETTNINDPAKKEISAKRIFWTAPTVYCILTYFPFMKLFVDLILAILNNLKNQRIKLYSEKLIKKQDIIKEIDADFMLKEFEKESANILQKIFAYSHPLNFNEKIIFPYKNSDISFIIPSEEKAYLMEGLWGSPLAFSNLAFDDMIFVLFSLFLEAHVLFVSQNLCLLTMTILTFYALLKPIKWPHPSIFNLPFTLIPMLESPVPIICGLNESMAFVIQNEYHKSEEEKLLIVFLDQNIIYMKEKLAKEINTSIPIFGNFKNRLKSLYDILNPLPSKNFQNIKKTKKNQYSYKIPDLNQKANPKKLNYTPTNKEMYACEEIFKGLKNVIENHIIKKIPQQPPFIENDRNRLNFALIEEKIIQGKPQQDQIFLKKLMQTQLFIYFLEEFYEL